MRMESSEEEEDFPSIETVTPQSKIDTIYQSNTEKGIRKICFELLDLKDAVENLCSDRKSKYLAFLRLTEEVVEVEHELNDLRKHISAHAMIIQELLTGACQELDKANLSDSTLIDDFQDQFSDKIEDQTTLFLENIDVLLAEHRIDEVIEAIEAEELKNPCIKSALSTRKNLLETQLIEITQQPFININELKKALLSLKKLGKASLAHQLLLKSYSFRLQKRIEAFLPLCACYPQTYSATLSNLIFSNISLTLKESMSMFGDNLVYYNKVVQFAESEIESFVKLVKEEAPLSETSIALRAASVCVQASLNHSLSLESSQGLKLTKLLLVLLQPYLEEVLELNFRRARKFVLDFDNINQNIPLSPRFESPLTTFKASDNLLVNSGMRFIHSVKDITDQLTKLVITHFGGNILIRISDLFEKYVNVLIKALPGTTGEENIETVPFRAETDSEQLGLLGTAFTIAEELLPMVVSKIWNCLNEVKEEGETIIPLGNSNSNLEIKEWKRMLQHSLDKLRDHFCQQYVVSFIYSRDGRTRLDAQIYMDGKGSDLILDSDPLPSLPFQALFGKLQQLATVAGDVLLGRERLQKVLLARLTETVVIWLSNESEFWSVLEDLSIPLQPQGLQQLILDMHFTVEIARFAGYPSRQVHQIASDIIARAIRTFSARGIDPLSALPEDEWFVETAKGAINKLLLGASGSDTSEIDEDHMILHDEIISDSEASPSSLSSLGDEDDDDDDTDSFASAEMGDLDSPVFTDSEN